MSEYGQTYGEREALAEAAYPSAPFYETGHNPWPQSFRNAFMEGWDARGSTHTHVCPESQGEPSDAQALEDFLAKLAGSGAYTLDFTSAESLHGHIVGLLKRDIAALRAAGQEGATS